MDQSVIENQHLRDNQLFGRIVGVWPKQEKFMKYSIRFVIFVITVCSNAAQIAQVVVFFSGDTLTEQLPFIGLGLGVWVKQFNYILNEAKLNKLLNGIAADWLVERPEEEYQILEKHFRSTAYFSSFYKHTIMCCTMTFVALPTIPPIMDIISPLNESRPLVLVYPSYYFVDEQEYYYLILGHMIVSAFIVMFVFTACDLNFIHVVQHACALFAISGHRFKHAADEVDFCKEKGGYELGDQSYAKMRRSIEAHKKATEYVELVEACHAHSFLLALGIVLAALTVTFVKLATMEMCTAYVSNFGFALAQLIHLFFLTIMGQFVINSNEELYLTICEANWYNCPMRTQLLYVLVLRKCLNSPKLTGGGFFSMDLDSFVKVLKASMSYYTVLKTS